MKLSRRDFARAASLAAGAALLPRRAAAQPATESAPPPAPSPTPPSLPKLSPAAQAEVSARIQLVTARWGTRLGPQDRALVAALCAEMQGPLEALRAAPLDVTDEPALLFRAARKKR